MVFLSKSYEFVQPGQGKYLISNAISSKLTFFFQMIFCFMIL